MVLKAGRFLALLAAVLTITILLAAPASAADVRQGDKLVIPAGEVVNDDLYLFGSGITIDGTVNGDVIAFGNNIVVNGPVNGSINSVGNYTVIKGQVKGSVRAAASNLEVDSSIGGDLVAAASRIDIMPSGSVGRDLLTAAATVYVEGPVAKDIRGSAGDLIINSSVGGNVNVECRAVTLEPAASISGDLTYKSENLAEQAGGSVVKGQVKQLVPPPPPPSPFGEAAGKIAAWAASATVLFIVIMLILFAFFKFIAAFITGIIFILVARKYVPGLVETLKRQPWPCLGYGALLFFLTPIAIVIAFILIITIPLGLAGLILYFLAIYLAKIFTALFIGKWMLRQGADTTATGPLIGALALGLLIVYVVSAIPVIGCLSDLAAVLFGLGAIFLFIKSKAA